MAELKNKSEPNNKPEPKMKIIGKRQASRGGLEAADALFKLVIDSPYALPSSLASGT